MIPMLIGSYARRTNVQRGFSIAVAAALGLSVISKTPTAQFSCNRMPLGIATV